MAEQLPIDELPPYVEAEPGAGVRHTLEVGQVISALAFCLAGVVGAVTGRLLIAPPEGMTPLAAGFAVVTIVAVGGAMAFEDWRRGPLSHRAGYTMTHPEGVDTMALAVLAKPRVLLGTVAAGVAAAASGLVFSTWSSILAGQLMGASIVVLARFVQLDREAKRTGWLRVLTRPAGQRKWDRTRSYVGDGLVIPALGWPVSLAAPLDQLDVPSLAPDERWCVLSALGNHGAAIAAITPVCGPAEPSRALLAAVSLVLLDRPGEAEVWVQRAVDDGFREKIHPGFVEALKPLHHSAAWKALGRQAR